jgi:phosphoribosylaminoimidazolecarboxamide formyltransferase/IMP cyclohydrolase
MPIALISVSDKTGATDFAGGLAERGWTIVSTGGTARELKGSGIPVTPVEEFTGFPEILEGRVKTLHPKIHAGLLARRSVSTDMQALSRHDLEPVDLVAVNLYPFRETVSRSGVTLAEAQDQIDIGGPTLLRAAAKNHGFVWPVCDPSDYDRVLEALDREEDALELRRRLAAKVFSHTAGYDAAIAGFLGEATRPDGGGEEISQEMLWSLVRRQTLRYGENPDQPASFYREATRETWGIPALEQLHGKELSYNNLLDVDGALTAIAPFLEDERAACAIIKHTTPCGIAVGRSAADAYEKALACDPMSAFGSVVALSHTVTEALAEELAELFVECVVAPGYAHPALRILQEGSENIRILQPGEGSELAVPRGHVRPGLEVRGVQGGMLVQRPPASVDPGALDSAEDVTVPTRRQPDEREWRDLGFAWAAVQSVKSNAILLARDGASLGIGAGQTSRVDAVKIARRKAEEFDHDTTDAVLASDAFFPFRDGIDAAARAGVSAVIQPGGSKRDPEVVEAADEHGMAMVMTGRRVFRH